MPIDVISPAYTFGNPRSLDATFWFRELLRGNIAGFPMPTGRDGFVVEDLDLIIRWYGPQFGLDSIGRLRLCEIKYHPMPRPLVVAQQKTFGLLARMCENDERFDGLYVINLPLSGPEVDWAAASWCINGQYWMDTEAFLSWCKVPVSHIPRLTLS